MCVVVSYFYLSEESEKSRRWTYLESEVLESES